MHYSFTELVAMHSGIVSPQRIPAFRISSKRGILRGNIMDLDNLDYIIRFLILNTCNSIILHFKILVIRHIQLLYILYTVTF